MGRVKSIAVVIFLILFFTITSIYSCSDKGKLVTYRSQAGERLLNFLYKENLSRNILNIDNFRFYEINIILSGEKDKYESFIIKHGYLKMDDLTFCKDGNSIKVLYVNKNTLLKYSYDDHYCKETVDGEISPKQVL